MMYHKQYTSREIDTIRKGAVGKRINNLCAPHIKTFGNNSDLDLFKDKGGIPRARSTKNCFGV